MQPFCRRSAGATAWARPTTSCVTEVPARHAAGTQFGLSYCMHGDLVLATPPPDVAQLAALRDYLPRGVPLVKRVEAQQTEHF